MPLPIIINPLLTKFSNMHFHLLAVVDRGSETQLKFVKILIFVNFETKHLQVLLFKY